MGGGADEVVGGRLRGGRVWGKEVGCTAGLGPEGLGAEWWLLVEMLGRDWLKAEDVQGRRVVGAFIGCGWGWWCSQEMVERRSLVSLAWRWETR